MTREEGFRCEVVPAVPPFNMPGDYDDARIDILAAITGRPFELSAFHIDRLAYIGQER